MRTALAPFYRLSIGIFNDWQKYGDQLPSDKTLTVFGDDDYIITIGDLRRAITVFDGNKRKL